MTYNIEENPNFVPLEAGIYCLNPSLHSAVPCSFLFTLSQLPGPGHIDANNQKHCNLLNFSMHI